MTFDITGRVAIVTGAGRGLGRCLALGLSNHGAYVVVSDIQATAAGLTAEAIIGEGGTAIWSYCDVQNSASCDAMVQAALERFGHVDILVNNAGIDVIEGFGEIDAASWNHVMQVNLTGVLNASRAVVPSMSARGRGGSIINISSVASAVGIPGLASYSASKAGVNQLTRVMAVELANANVRVNAIAPGYLDHIMTGGSHEHEDPRTEQRIRARTPMGRRARLDEIVGPVVFLAADASSYVTGAILFVDGGYSAA